MGPNALQMTTADREREAERILAEAAARTKLIRFEKMIEVPLWTNRLDEQLQIRLKVLNSWFKCFGGQIEAVEQACGDNRQACAKLAKLRKSYSDIYQELYPEIIEFCVIASGHAHIADAIIIDLEQKLKPLELRVLELEKKLRDVNRLRYLVSRISGTAFRCYKKYIKGEVPQLAASAPAEVPPLESYNLFADVSTENSALEIFDDWVTIYHHKGKRLGSSKPSVTDFSGYINDANERLRFRGKTILELGPFEGGNTKQMLELGAEKVVGIEANPQFFLKCLLVKNEFALAGAEFIYGDCNKLLADKNFLARYKFDICLASGILYHMAEPLKTIELISKSAPAVCVWSQVASDKHPEGEWVTQQDRQGNSYQGRVHRYESKAHWGGVRPYAVWLTHADLARAFEVEGYTVEHISNRTDDSQPAIFVARNKVS